MRPRLAIAVICAALVAWLGLAGAPDASPGAAPVSAQLPAGWHRSAARLVPQLLMPRERISVGTRPAVGLQGLRGGPIYRATIPFRDHGRAFDALIYTAGRPSPGLRDQIDSLLTGLPLPR
jgi:hypothetical protein